MELTMIYISAVLVSIVLEHQERRHRFELMLEYERLGKAPPPERPKLPLAVAWLNVVVGIVLFGGGALFVSTAFRTLHVLSGSMRDAGGHIVSQFELGAVLLAASLSLIILGVRSMRQHRRLSKRA